MITMTTNAKAEEIARRLTPAMRDELLAPNPGEGNQRVVGALVRRHLLTPVHMGGLLVHQLTELGLAVRAVLTSADDDDEWEGCQHPSGSCKPEGCSAC